jgi:luciferase family oxidoreductase group 1
VRELQKYFARPVPGQPLRAIPGAGLNVPIYLLGSSDFNARLAAELGLPFGFASHFAPDYLDVALDLYRQNFQPSPQLAKPHVMIGVNVIAAETDEEARRLFTSVQQMFLGMIRGARTELPPPVESMEGRWSALEEAHASRMLRCSAVGSAETVATELEVLIERTGADEVIATAQIFDHAARLRSFEIAAEVFRELDVGVAGSAGAASGAGLAPSDVGD